MLASRRFSFHRPTISSGNVLDYQDPVTIELTTALNNTNQANVVTFTIDTNLTTEPKLFYEITGNHNINFNNMNIGFIIIINVFVTKLRNGLY